MNSSFRLFTLPFLASALVFANVCPSLASVPVPYPLMAQTGTPAEQNLLLKNAGSAMQGKFRHADKGQFWIYGFPVAPSARCTLTLTLDNAADSLPPVATVLGADNKPLAIHTETAQGLATITWTVPIKWPVGNRMSVLLSAKNGPAAVKSVQLAQTLPDSVGDGVPDVARLLLMTGLPPNTRLSVTRPPAQPFTITAASLPITPSLDVQTDAVFVDSTDPAVINSWKARGYTVWSAANSRRDSAFTTAHKDDVQTLLSGKPAGTGGNLPVSGSPSVLLADRSLLETLLGAGSDGFCLQEPEYWANAGYEPAFKQAWQAEYKMPWLDPVSTLDARYKASRLMAGNISSRVQSAMQGVQIRKPGARRLVTLHSPLYAAQAGLVSPTSRIAALNEVTDVIGAVGTDTASLPMRYAGLRQDRTFARAYLEYSALLHAARNASKRVWFLTDPHLNSTTPATNDTRADYEQTLIAALLLGDVNAYQLALPPQTLTSELPPDQSVRIQNVLAALEDMHNQTGISGNADKDDDIGVLVSDTIQWQREGPASSDLDSVFGLALPLLQRGIPVQVLSLDRAADPGYLNNFKTLLVSYDFQKPLGARTQQALAEWTRRGGSLIYVGGTDAYNRVSDAWWQQAGLIAPQMDLWKQLGLDPGNPTPRMAPSEDANAYKVVLQAAAPEKNFANRHAYTVDLTPYAASTGSVAVRISALNPADANNALVSSGELSVSGKVAASFTAGSEIENRFLVFDNNSQFNGRDRIAEGGASWTYQFDNLPSGVPIQFTLSLANAFVVSAAPARPEFGHTLLSAGTNVSLSKSFPRLRIGASYPVTLSTAPQSTTANPQSTILYTLRAGGAPVWMQNVGRGLVLNVGIAPGFFSASERSAGLLRALIRFAHQRAGGTYREPGFLRIKRGRYSIVHTFSEPLTIEGRMIDALSPTLNTADDRTITPDSSALLYDLGSPDAEPHIGFVSGRLQARVETPTTTGFWVRGAAGTTGMARLHKGNRRLIGARAMDWLGRPVPIQAQEDGGTLLLRYANHPDGVIIRVGWQ